MSDPGYSDEATGLPPLTEPDPAMTMVVLAYDVSVGLAAVPTYGDVPVRYLHVRGLANGPDGQPEWVQSHIAVPVTMALDVAAALAKGSTEELG